LFVTALSNCGTKLPPIPPHDQGTLIERSDGSVYAYWVPYYSGSPYREDFQKFLDKKAVCVSGDDYSKLKKYSQDVLEIIKKSCPNLVK
jgi:hypothetical protein